ncbi:glycosyltransferase family 4 protein [Bradyrhizobium sp. B117]|uniref:glycosyltransferase family 4 protein n=1 Tax=Bradyrhizobium sp. B117 TaxID=3140246 RepID=UPI003183F0BA
MDDISEIDSRAVHHHGNIAGDGQLAGQPHARKDLPNITPDSHFDVAYIVNHYPKVSHSFIRREILELERLGLRVLRISVRGWDAPLVDPADVSEAAKTIFVLKQGIVRLLLASIVQAISHPGRFWAATVTAVRMMRGSDRPAIWHLFYLAEACWIAGQIEGRAVPHLHAHFGTNSTEVAALTSILAGVTYSFTVHGPEEFDKLHSLHLARKIERAAFVVAISSFCRSQLYRVTNFRAWPKIHVVHCGIDQEFGALDAGEAPISNTLVCVGRLCEQKGQLLLVETIAELVKEGIGVRLVLVGDGEFREPIERLISENGFADHVRITGWATAAEVKQEILNARALILPSFAEGLPVVLMEAMVLAKPVLSTFVAGIPELVIDGGTGWLFPAGSKAEMKTAIRKCLETSPETLLSMGRRGRERALARHDLRIQGKLLADLFQTVAPTSQTARISHR